MISCFNGATSMPYGLERDIEAAGKAGFEAIELWGAKFDRFFAGHDIPALARLLNANRLKAAAIDFVAIDLNNPEPLAGVVPAVNRYGEVAAGIGCDTLLLIVQGDRPELAKPQALNYIAKLMLPLCAVARRHGLKLALEPLAEQRLIRGPLEALQVINISRQENLGISWDLFHSFKAGVPLSDVRRIPPDRLYMVHASDVPAKDRATLSDADRLLPGEGSLPLDDYLEVLRDLDYKGPVSVEVPNPMYWQLDLDSLVREAFESLGLYMPARV